MHILYDDVCVILNISHTVMGQNGTQV